MYNFKPSKKLVISCFFIGLSAIAFAQAKKGLKSLEKGDYEDAKMELLQSLNDEKERPIGLYGLAQLYLQPGFSGYEPDSAISYITQADDAYRALGYKDKNKIQKDVNVSLFRKLKKEIVEKALERAQEEGTVEAYQHFLDFYPKPGYRNESDATSARNELAFDAAEAEGTWQAWANLIDKYGTSLAEKNPDLDKKADMALFEGYLAEHGLEAYDSFAVRYPKNVYVRDSLMPQFLTLTKSNKPADYQQFIAAHEGSPFVSLAKDSLASKLIQYGEEEPLLAFINANPNHPRMNSLKRAHYRAYIKTKLTLEAVENYQKRYPDYPYPEELAADIEKYKAQQFTALLESDDLIKVKAFVQENPGYPELNRLWSHYYDLYKDKNPEPEAIDRFVRQNPDFPFRDRVEADKLVARKQMQEHDFAALQGSQSTQAYRDYLSEYPDSEHREEVITQLGDVLMDSNNKRHLREYLQDFPESKKRKELLNKLYDLISADQDLREIVDFQKDFPEYPYQERIERDKEKAMTSFAQLGTYQDDKRSVFEAFIQNKAPGKEAMKALREMLKEDLKNRRWKEAGEKIAGFKPYFGTDPGFEELHNVLTAPDQGITAKSMGDGINSSDREEYASTMSADGKLLYFCRNLGGIFKANEDIYISRKVNGQWLEAKPIDELNTTGNEAPEGISADGNQMIIFQNGKLCTIEKTTKGWSDPEQLPSTINRSDWQADARITADGKAVLFSSGTNWGQKDIYVSELQSNGKWGPAKGLGPMINTDGTDRSAFLHPDMKTLYFSSDGRNGLGGLDIYVSKRLDDSWTNWSEPINIGTAINTADNDWGFKVTTEGDSAYYAVEGASNTSDIYIVKVPEVYQPERVSTIAGKLVGMDGKPVQAEIEWIDLMSGEVVQVTRNDPETGEFFATLPDDGKFGYSIRKEGFFPLSGNIEVTDGENKFELKEEMTLASVEEMKEKEIKIPLNNLFFETASFEIEATSFPQLDRLVKWIKENDLAIEIQGHTDNVGADDANQQLSQNRANAVRQYLMKKGVAESKVTAVGYGENKPVASNDTEEGRAQNRRVEIQLK